VWRTWYALVILVIHHLRSVWLGCETWIAKNNIQKEMYCSASFLGLRRPENLHYWILSLEGILVVTLKILSNTTSIIEHHLILIEFMMQVIFWSLQSNQRGSLCCKCCWYFYGKWYLIFYFFLISKFINSSTCTRCNRGGTLNT